MRCYSDGFLFIFFGIFYLTNAQQLDITLEENQRVELNSPQYPEYASVAEIEWNIHTNNPEAQIELKCMDLRLIEVSPCKDYISIDDGNDVRNLCGTQSGLTVVSKGQNMIVKLHVGPSSAVAMNCEVYLLLKIIPTVVNLRLRDPAYLLHTPKDMPARYDKRWIFRTVPGLRVALTCNDFRYVTYRDKCMNGMEIDDGQTSKPYCGSQSGLIVFSVGIELKVRFFTGFYGGGVAKCMLQAVNGPSNLQYENEASPEIDSSEHGITPGRKSTTCKCGWRNHPVGRIAHGQETGINEFPWMVAIRESLKPGEHPPPFHFCGGSIITHYHVLSAAHCVYYRMDEELYAVVGEHNIRTTSETNATQHIKIARKILPDDYQYPNQHHDIALLVLAEAIVYGPRVGPICLSPKRFDIAYQHILLTGWGMTHQGRPSDVLMRAYLRVVDLKICSDIWQYGFSISEDAHKVCTDSRKKDSCSGDSGGPLVIIDPETNRYNQVSLVSFGAGCNVGKPGVTTEIFPFYDWILKGIKDTYPQEIVCTRQE